MSTPDQGRNWRLWLYIAACCCVLAALGVANARGYVPFASPQSKVSEHTANHFHK